MKRRAAALLASFGALALPGGAVAQETGEEPPEPPPPPPSPPHITSELPRWVAPGGRVVVRGRTEPQVRVQLRFGERTLASRASGDLGWFRFDVRAPAAGHYRVRVATPDAVARVGRIHVRPLVLAASGDVTFGARVLDAINRWGARYPWLSVAPVLRRADLATANLETAVSTRGAPVPKEYTFRGPPRALRAAARFAGMDVMSLANNHALDYGRVAFRDTLRYAREYGVATPGGGRDLSAARRARIRTVGGLRVAFLAYSDVRPLGFDATATRSGAAPAFPELIRPDVRAAKRGADLVVAWFHWGIERTFSPTARQRSLARVSFDAGADVVLGAHPHVLQPIRRTNTRLVAWSLGNFVFGANSPGTERTGILRMKLTRAGVVDHAFRRARIGGELRVQPQLLR
ncbi:MAG: CapA family protein [Actinobacteria bacterium]|nr:CapA family protein [Actinomycetota bacterium]